MKVTGYLLENKLSCFLFIYFLCKINLTAINLRNIKAIIKQFNQFKDVMISFHLVKHNCFRCETYLSNATFDWKKRRYNLLYIFRKGHAKPAYKFEV